MQRFTLDVLSTVRVDATALGGAEALLALTAGPACAFYRDPGVLTPAHYEGALASLSNGSMEIRAVLRPGEHCLIGGAASLQNATGFAYRVFAQPTTALSSPFEFAVLVPRAPPTVSEPTVAFDGEPWSPAWIRSAIAYYRGFGFFGANESDAEAAEFVTALIIADWGSLGAIQDAGDVTDWYLLYFDEARVWCHDLERDVLEGNRMYERALLELAAVSGGRIVVANVTESWETEDGPVRVNATVNGARVWFGAQAFGDWYDFRAIMLAFNRWLDGSGYVYASTGVDGQRGFATVLSVEDAARLERERAWQFT